MCIYRIRQWIAKSVQHTVFFECRAFTLIIEFALTQWYNGCARDAAICIPGAIIGNISNPILPINREEFLDESTGGYNNGPKISIDNNTLSIDRRAPEEAYITTGTVINCGYYREIAVLNHARYASANISPSRDRARDRTMASRKCIDRFRSNIYAIPIMNPSGKITRIVS